MNRILSFSILVILLCAQNLLASTLVYKFSKTIDSTELVEFTNFDASKYKQIRITIQKKREKNESVESATFNAFLYAIENDEEIFVTSEENNVLHFSTVLDSPPSKIRVKLSGKGQFSIHVWATQ